MDMMNLSKRNFLLAFLVLVSPVIVSGVWTPAPGTTWQWQLTGHTLDTSLNVDMYDVDLYETSAADFSTLKTAGKIVICYFSAGTREDYRDDANDFPAATIGTVLPDWQDENWIDIRDATVRTIMGARLDYAVTRGCDGVEPDNMDGYSNVNGLSLTATDQIEYNQWIADQAHNRGLSVGLKNDVDQLSALVSHYDWALNEECLDYNECGAYSVFLNANKAVFHTEYVDHHWQGASKKSTVCSSSGRPSEFSTLIKDWDLTAWRLAC